MPTHNRPRTCPAATRRSPKPTGWTVDDSGMLYLLQRTNLELTLGQCRQGLYAGGDALHGGDLWDIYFQSYAANLVAIETRTGGGIWCVDNQVNLTVQNQIHYRAAFGTVANLGRLLHG